MHLKLRAFDPSRIPDDKICVFIGKRGYGKSWLMRDVMWHKRNIQSGVVMSPTEVNTGFWSKYIPDIFIHTDYNPKLIKGIMEKQKARARQHGKEKVSPVFAIIEDCMYDKTMSKDKNARELFMNGRHLKIFTMLTLQYVKSIPPELRSNADFVFVLKENNQKNRAKLYEEFFGIIPTLQIFNEILLQTTSDYSALVIDNTSTSSKIEDNVFWYKAKDRGPFRVGGRGFWSFHESFYRSPSDRAGSDSDDEDPKGKGDRRIISVDEVSRAARKKR